MVAGGSDVTGVGGERLPREGGIRCDLVRFGLKRDVGMGARVAEGAEVGAIELDRGPVRVRRGRTS